MIYAPDTYRPRMRYDSNHITWSTIFHDTVDVYGTNSRGGFFTIVRQKGVPPVARYLVAREGYISVTRPTMKAAKEAALTLRPTPPEPVNVSD